MLLKLILRVMAFQSTYLYKVRPLVLPISVPERMFQSTYLYKVRHTRATRDSDIKGFQSTYLYKVRHNITTNFNTSSRFQSTYLYKVRLFLVLRPVGLFGFNPRTYIRYDRRRFFAMPPGDGFNPRTYIRYDLSQHPLNVT